MYGNTMVWGLLTGMFILGVYLVDKLIKRGDANPSATWMQKHVVVVGIVAVVVPVAVGIIIVNTTVYGTTKVVSRHSVHSVSTMPAALEPPKPEPILKLIISDGSQETDITTLNLCKIDEVTMIQNGAVHCEDTQSPIVKAWMADVRVHEDRALEKFIKHQVKKKTYKKLHVKQIQRELKKPKVMQQSFLNLFAQAVTGTNAEKATTETKTTVTKKPFKDRYATIFYFLALVLGVLGKYYWDYFEDKRIGKQVTFQPHLIVISFIIAGLVYYSIQQGLEKEAGRLSSQGVLFAFNNGFMWQTVLTSLSRSRNGHATLTPGTDPKPEEPSA